MGTYAKPYLSGIRVNLHDFVAKQQGYNQQRAPVTAFGKQRPSLSVDLDLYLGQKNVGKQTYTFTEKDQPATASHSGIPAHTEVLPDAIVSIWETEFKNVIDSNMPAYFDESKEAQAAGPAIFPRINRIEASLPYSKPAERYIAAVIGVYEDAECTRQVVDADFVIVFCQDEMIVAQSGQELSAEVIAQVRSLNDRYSLADFLANPQIQQSIGAMAASVFSTLKSQVYQWADIDVPTIMKSFTIPVE